MHGGLFSNDNVKLDDIRKIERNRQPPEEGTFCELLWSDPQNLVMFDMKFNTNETNSNKSSFYSKDVVPRNVVLEYSLDQILLLSFC